MLRLRHLLTLLPLTLAATLVQAETQGDTSWVCLDHSAPASVGDDHHAWHTLLDLHFDNHFWMEHLPQRYAELHGVSRAMAEMELQPLFERNAGQLQWYCLDF